MDCTASYTEDYGHMIELTWNDPTTFDLDEDSTYKYSYSLIESMLQPRAQPDWTYEFPDGTGPDTQNCWSGPA